MLAEAPHKAEGAARPAGETSRGGQLAVAPLVWGNSQLPLQPPLDACQGFGFGVAIGLAAEGKPGARRGEHAGDHGGLAGRGPAIALAAHRHKQGARLVPVELQVGGTVALQQAPVHGPVEHHCSGGIGEARQPAPIAPR